MCYLFVVYGGGFFSAGRRQLKGNTVTLWFMVFVILLNKETKAFFKKCQKQTGFTSSNYKWQCEEASMWRQFSLHSQWHQPPLNTLMRLFTRKSRLPSGLRAKCLWQHTMSLSHITFQASYRPTLPLSMRCNKKLSNVKK